jgi:hypothetical protein
MKKCHIDSRLECIHLEGVCVARGLELVGCSDLRHYLANQRQKKEFAKHYVDYSLSLETYHDYPELHDGVKGQDGWNK